MTSPKVKIIEFYAQEKYEPPKASVPYKPQKFYVDVKLEEPVTIDDMADNIVQRLKTATKREGIKTKRLLAVLNFLLLIILLKKKLGIVQVTEMIIFFNLTKTNKSQKDLCYI